MVLEITIIDESGGENFDPKFDELNQEMEICVSIASDLDFYR